MPLRVAEILPSSPREITDQFVVFYSSIVDGQLWCPVSPFAPIVEGFDSLLVVRTV